MLSDAIWLEWGINRVIMESVAEGQDLNIMWRILNVRLKHLHLIQHLIHLIHLSGIKHWTEF